MPLHIHVIDENSPSPFSEEVDNPIGAKAELAIIMNTVESGIAVGFAAEGGGTRILLSVSLDDLMKVVSMMHAAKAVFGVM